MATGQVLFFKAGSCFAPSASLLKIENCARLAIHNNNNNNKAPSSCLQAPSSCLQELLQSIGAECEVGPRLILVVSSPGVGNSSSQFSVDGCWQELHIHSLSSEVHASFVTL